MAGDLDGDGDLDVVCGNASSVPCLANPQNRAYLNLRRQLHAPTAPRIGQFHALDAYLRYGPPSTVDLAAVYLSTAANSVALPPFGVLGIDPTAAVPFPTLLIPQPAGFGTVGFTVPYQPNLVGQAIYSQAMLVAYPNDLHLSNVVREVVQTCLVPTVTAMPFTTGPAMGGGPFEVHGQNLLGATVTFEGVPMTNITSQTATEIIGQVPPGAAGPATVVISNGLACQATATYTYHAIPTITSITPAVALPGAPVTIHGSNFLSGLSLAVDGNATPISSWTATTVSFQLPPGTGCDTLVEVTNVGGFSASQLMNQTPVVTFSTAAGPAAGGALFVVAGQHLLGVTVTFNGVPMTSFSTQTALTLVGLTPPGAVGPATVLVTNALGCSASLTYTYQ